MSNKEERSFSGLDADESPFQTVSDTQVSFADRAGRAFDEFVVAPAKILWGDWRARVGGLIILFFIGMGTLGPMVVPAPETNMAPRLLTPMEDTAYPLGTDSAGRTLLSMVVHATPPMLKMIVAGAVFSTGLATIVGTFSGYKGGRVDQALMTVSDVLMTIPGLPLIIVLAALFQPESAYVIGILLTINRWAGLSRTIRSQVLTIRNREYVEVSRTMGIPTHRIVAKDILPNIMPYVTVNFVNLSRQVIFASVALYYLGVLPSKGIKNWGVIMELAFSSGGALFTWKAAHWLYVPMAAIVLLSLGLILFAQGTDRIFNPRIRAKHAKGHRDADHAPEGGH